MTLYFDTKAQFLDGDAVSTVCCWHSRQPLFAVASYNQDRGACVTIFDDSGEPLRDVTFPVHSVSQATSLSWHPERRQLVGGWENGELNAWSAGQRTFSSIISTHKAPIVYVGFSEQGGRMVTADAMGILTGWRCDSHNGQFTAMFTHDFRDSVTLVTFLKTVKSLATDELNNLAKAAVSGDEVALDTLANWRPRTAARGLTHAGVKDNQCFYVGCQSGAVFYVNQSGACNEVLRGVMSPITQMLWHPKREVVVTLMEDMMVGHYMVESVGTLTELECVKLSGKVPGKNGFISWAGSSLAVITGDFTVRIFDLDTSDSFLLPMNQTKKDSTEIDIKTIQKKESPINLKKSRSILDRSFESDEEIAVTVDDDDELITKLPSPSAKIMEVFTTLSYCSENQTLCAGTNQGNLYIWKRNTAGLQAAINGYENGVNGHDSLENFWHLCNIANVRGPIKHCSWGVCDVSTPCVLVNCISNVYILKEQPLLTAYSPNIWIRQKSATQLYVEHSTNFSTVLRSDLSAITDLCLNERNLAITNHKSIAIYKIPRTDEFKDKMNKNVSIKLIHTFSVTDCQRIFIYDEIIIVVGYQNVRIYSFGGIVLKEINFNDTEGTPIGASLTQQFMTIFTMNGFLKIYDISKHEPKLIVQPKAGYDLFGNFGEIIMAKCNVTGNRIAMTIATESLVPDGKLYIWDVEKDRLCHYDFLNDKYTPENDKKDTKDSLNDFNQIIRRVPISFCWDNEDQRILACETRRLVSNEKRPPTSMGTMRSGNKKSSPVHAVSKEQIADSQVFILFATNDSRNLVKSMENLDLHFGEQLIDMYTPYLITLKVGQIERNVLSNFKGIETTSETNRKLILDFSIFIADGKMDDAFRCIRSIQSDTVWENLAKKCVHTGRLDVAKICLGNLKKALSVRALRLAIADETLEPEAKIAVLAIELQMIPEAEALYKKCGRYDLLNELLQACGRYEEALQIAERLDRVHLKNTYFEYAEWLKGNGDINNAMIYYSKANNVSHNITQMLISEPSLLKQYVSDSTDANMLKWWAQYTESTGDMNGALKIYQKAEDWFSQVRILCFLGDISRADSIARESNDKSACYHMARHYENSGKIQDAIQFYTRAQTYGNAVRICKDHNLPNELWTVANLARSRDKAIAAAFFEEIEDYKRAVELYHRSGLLHKAVEMAFASEQPETLQVIAAELDTKSDPELVQRCAEFFVASQQPLKAANLLAHAKQYEKSLEICREFKVPLTVTLADLLTPAKEETEESLRIRVLTELGDVLQEQGDYHTATKKFTQAGDKIRAMKSLLKSGDTDKIVFFAGMSRQKEVYIMAANYLQSLNWQSDGKILKNIIQFYSKAHAFDLFANFYANCAQVEIDEFHDYEKAIKALQEASRCVTKMAGDSIQHKRVSDNLQSACVEVRKVLEIQDALERGEYNNVVAVCKSMLSIPERPPVRAIHIQAILIEALIRNRRYTEAMESLTDLSTKSTDWSYKGLIEKPLIEKLAHECDVEFSTIWNMGRQDIANVDEIHENEDEIQEEIE